MTAPDMGPSRVTPQKLKMKEDLKLQTSLKLSVHS